MNRDGSQTETVLTADHILGPYTKVREGLKPLNMSAGDFDLAVAPDGKAYYYFERVHSETICADLTADYTDVTGYYSTHFPHISPPYVREATAHFMRRGKHYLVTSGTTGYLPNPSEVAMADTWHGPYAVLGNPHPGDESRTSFHSQISSVFQVEGKKDLYIAVADRWVPDDPVDRQRADLIRRAVASRYEPDRYPVTEEEREIFRQAPMLKNAATSRAGYVWLPVLTDGGRVRIEWKDFWRV